MLKDFISNAALLIAAFSFLGQVFKDRPLRFSSPLSTKIYWGLCFGLLGNILMLFSIHINPTTIADLRHLSIVIAAAFGGIIPAMIGAIIIALGRILLFGINQTSLHASIGILLTGIICGGISKLNYNATGKAFFMNLIGLFIVSIILFLNINDMNMLKNILIYHYLFSLIGGFIAYHFAHFISDSNEAQRQQKNILVKLKDSEERFRLLAEYSSDMITMHNGDREYIYISPAVKEIIKYEYPELLGRKMENFIHLDDINGTNQMFDKALSEGFAESTYRYQTKTGEYVWIESRLKSVPFQEDGAKRVIIVSRNITDRKLMEQKLKEANELLNQLSYMDGLTGIANRRYFDQTLRKEWTKLTSTNCPLTLVMFDIDYFKKYNDTYGHLEGDRCLQTIALAIKEQTMKNAAYTFCRYGGEEFALILPALELQDGIKIAAHIQKAVQTLNIPHISSEISNIVTLSIGIATLSPKSSSIPEDLIQLADESLYFSKTKGRNIISTVQ